MENDLDFVKYTLTLTKQIKNREKVIELELPLSISTLVVYDTIKNNKEMENELVFMLCERIQECVDVRWENKIEN